MVKVTSWLAAFAAVCLGCSTASRAVVLDVGESARINFNATTAPAPFDFVTFSLMFSDANPFGPNETLSYKTSDGNNATLVSNVFSSGSSIYTSGLFGQLTQNAIMPLNPSTLLTTQSFSVLVTAVTGSFDLTGATADFEHIIYTSGPNQLGVPGTFAVPELSTWVLLLAGFAGLGLIARTSSAARIMS